MGNDKIPEMEISTKLVQIWSSKDGSSLMVLDKRVGLVN